MKIIIIFFLIMVSNHLLAIKVLPNISKSLDCINVKNGKTKTIHQNAKITIWYNNGVTQKKTNGTLLFVDDSIVFVRKAGSDSTMEIPIHTIQGISKRNATKLIASIASFIPTSILSAYIISVLNIASKNTNTRGNGMAGVIGIVLGILIFPLFIASTIILIKQLLHKKMFVSNGWKFEASKDKY